MLIVKTVMIFVILAKMFVPSLRCQFPCFLSCMADDGIFPDSLLCFIYVVSDARKRCYYQFYHTLWRIDPLLRGDSVNISRCYGAPAAYACAVTSHNNRRGGACGVLCGSATRIYDSTDSVLLSEWVQCSWGFTCGVLNSGQRKRYYLHC
jgi:hypothetical protein